ncbi:MAG: hypothetical protein HQL45_16465 [Alphaproteobacteria bacterium]|nr:hypothetical protein [Alphaproteobacteria bacterium]
MAKFRAMLINRLAGNPSPSEETLASELEQLESRLRDEKRKTELLAKISYANWKLRKEAEKEYAIKYRVTMPCTSAQRDEDRFFTELEARMERERLDYVDRQRALEFQGQKEERQKLERDSAECVLKVLEEDLV